MKLASQTLLALALLTPVAFVQATETKTETKTETSTTTTTQNQASELTVEGPIAKVVARKKEIYVQGPDKKHEFYFKKDTQLTQGGQPAEFSVLKEGQKVRVTYKLVGKRQDPLKVEILQ